MEFYIFDSKLLSSTIQVQAVGLMNVLRKGELEAEWRLIMGNYAGISFPVIFKEQYGKKFEDILDTGWPSLYLISDKMKNVLEDSNLTGWKIFAIKLLDKKNQEIRGYHGLSITGQCGPINYKEDTIFGKRLAPNAPLSRYYKGLYLGLAEWDNSDFFMAKKYFGIFVSERASTILKINKITNLKLINIKEIETDEYTAQVAMKN